MRKQNGPHLVSDIEEQQRRSPYDVKLLITSRSQYMKFIRISVIDLTTTTNKEIWNYKLSGSTGHPYQNMNHSMQIFFHHIFSFLHFGG